MFCHKVALPLRNGELSIVHNSNRRTFIQSTRARYDRLLVFGIPLPIAAAIALWAWLNFWRYRACPSSIITAWLSWLLAVGRAT